MKSVHLSLAFMAFALLALMPLGPIGCGGSGGAAPVVGDLVVLAEGTNLHLLSVEATGVTFIGTASLPPGGLLGGHVIWNVVKHPTQPWLYACSGNECSSTGAWCWGNGRIDRFTYSPAGISYVGLAFLYDAAAGPACGANASGLAGQVGECAPVGMAFSSDATRLYVDDDEEDIFHIFSVDPAGAVTFIGDGGSTFFHGMATYPGGPYLYNGALTYDVTGDVAVVSAAGAEGNATRVVDLGGGALGLVTTEGVGPNDLAVYDLTVPGTPALIDRFDVSEGGTYGTTTYVQAGAARFQACSADASRIVVVGTEYIATIAFNGATLAVEDRIVDADPLDVINRGVALALNDTRALVAWFRPRDAAGNLQVPFDGGLTTYSIDPSGALAELGTFPFASQVRAVLNVP